MKQKDAVYQAVVNVTGFDGEGACVPTTEQRKQIYSILIEGFNQGKISLDRSFDEAGMKQYVSGLVSNWLRKDIRLNGGTKYVAKNPGSRAGQGDATLKAMRALLSTMEEGTDDYNEVAEEIEKHVAAIQAAKAPTINFDALPEHLRSKFSK